MCLQKLTAYNEISRIQNPTQDLLYIDLIGLSYIDLLCNYYTQIPVK